MGEGSPVAAAVRGRLDLVKDDRTLTDQSFSLLISALDAVMVALDKVEKETGKKAYYPVNVTAGADIILGRRRRQWRPGRGRFSSGNMQKTTKSWIQL
ncbi:MAG TPA: RuBisCO large subunit C-terminal-like domain-containing protein [Methanothrix sp.]|nr:RuBisCO large subunit C-terminal-like domain-containing protein [Methanothrix sp.]